MKHLNSLIRLSVFATGLTLASNARPALSPQVKDDLQRSLATTTLECGISKAGPMMRQDWTKVLMGAQARPAETREHTSDALFHDHERALNAVSADDIPQVVVLDFEVGEPTFTVDGAFGGDFDGIIFEDHVYTQEEKDEIQRRLEADFAEFNFIFTQTVPDSGDYTLLQFNSNDDPGETTAGILPDGGILFGFADEIDFGNNNRDSFAVIDANIWEFLFQIDPSGELITINAGITIDENTSAEDALSIAIVNQSANTGAHELGHTIGLRHYDAFGAPGDGLPSTGQPAPTAFFPIYTGPQAAAETTLHLMASGASSGLTLAGAANADRFFGERSLIKLTINENQARNLQESDLEQRNGFLNLRFLNVPNALTSGVNADSRFLIRNSVVEGAINTLDQQDEYRFVARAGSLLNTEMISTVDILEDSVFGGLRLFYQEFDGTRTLVAENSDEFESFDAFLLDVVLPYTGRYVLIAEAPKDIALDLDEDGIPESIIELTDENFGEGAEVDLRLGNYSLNVHLFDTFGSIF